MNDTKIKAVDVTIHPSALVPCPEKRFRQRYAAIACPKCPNFRGVGQMAFEEPGEKPIVWSMKYIIRCAHVIERRTSILDIVED